MCRLPITGAVLGLICLLCPPDLHLLPASAHYDEESPERRFLREAPAAWEEYENRTARCKGSFKSRWESCWTNPDKQSTSSAIFEFKRFNGFTFFYHQADDVSRGMGAKTDIGYGMNRDYVFEIRRRHPDGQWVLTHSATLEESADSFPVRRFEQALAAINAPVRAEGMPLAELIHKPEFRIVSCTNIHEDGDDLVQIVFQYSHDPRFYKYNLPDHVQKGTLTLDPARFWSIRRCELETEQSGVVTSVHERALELSIDGNTVPPAKKIEFVRTVRFTNGRTLREVGVSEMDLTEVHELGESEFTLSAFGLPEPWDLQQAAKKPTRWFLWLTLAGVAFLAVGAFFYYRARRRA